MQLESNLLDIGSEGDLALFEKWLVDDFSTSYKQSYWKHIEFFFGIAAAGVNFYIFHQ